MSAQPQIGLRAKPALGWDKMNNSEYSFSAFIGIDVAKNKIDIFEQESQTVKTVGNNKQEINTWIKTLTETEQTIVVMEATGGYESLLMELLHQHNIALAVVNPPQVRDFAKGVGCDAKTAGKNHGRTNRHGHQSRRTQRAKSGDSAVGEKAWSSHCQHFRRRASGTRTTQSSAGRKARGSRSEQFNAHQTLKPMPKKIQPPCRITKAKSQKSNSKIFFESVIDFFKDRRCYLFERYCA
jgi:hypothetical protein